MRNPDTAAKAPEHCEGAPPKTGVPPPARRSVGGKRMGTPAPGAFCRSLPPNPVQTRRKAARFDGVWGTLCSCRDVGGGRRARATARRDMSDHGREEHQSRGRATRSAADGTKTARGHCDRDATRPAPFRHTPRRPSRALLRRGSATRARPAAPPRAPLPPPPAACFAQAAK